MPETIMRDSKGNPIPGSADYGKGAQEETQAEKMRKVTAAWNTRYFAYLKVGTGIGGAAAIEKYKTANPGWEKKRDVWAQGVAKAARRPKVGPTLGDLAK